MFNEIWPTGGWGSIEYGSPVPGQVEGGRWKPLHYILRSSTFADQMATCNDAGACMVKNDSPFAFEGKINIRLVNIASGISKPMLTNHPISMAAGAGVAQWLCGAAPADALAEVEAAYGLHAGQIPVQRNNFTKQLSGAGVAKCETACDADKVCVGFTLSPATSPTTGTCWLYEAPHELFDDPGADWYQKPGTAPLPAPPPAPPPPPPCKPPPVQLACTAWSATPGFEAHGCDANGTNCVLVIEVTNSSGSRKSLNVLPFVPPKAMTGVPRAEVTATVALVDGRVVIELTTNATALFVVLTTKAIGRFSENAFLLEKSPSPHHVFFETWDDADDAVATAMAELKAGLRVEHLAQMLVPRPPPSPPPPPPPPLKPCPPAGCAGCGSPPCHWPFENNTIPSPSLPITGTVVNTTLGCEELCAAQGVDCVGFTQSAATCYLYKTVSRYFSHYPDGVSWHPKPEAGGRGVNVR